MGGRMGGGGGRRGGGGMGGGGAMGGGRPAPAPSRGGGGRRSAPSPAMGGGGGRRGGGGGGRRNAGQIFGIGLGGGMGGRMGGGMGGRMGGRRAGDVTTGGGGQETGRSTDGDGGWFDSDFDFSSLFPTSSDEEDYTQSEFDPSSSTTPYQKYADDPEDGWITGVMRSGQKGYDLPKEVTLASAMNSPFRYYGGY